jgi:membrane-associated phospholipid phosphatase
MAVLWLLYSRWRWLYALFMLAVTVCLLGANYHFLSDVIAGGFVGISVGWITVRMWQAGTLAPRVVDEESACVPDEGAPRSQKS